MEEYLNYLRECNERRITFKQAFSALGMVDKNKPLKQLTNEETFSALVNWALHRMPKLHSITLRIVHGDIYQTVLLKSLTRIRVGKLVRVTGPGGTAYDWPPNTKYESLEVAIIEESVHRADVINVEQGYDISMIEKGPQAQEQTDELAMEESAQETEQATEHDEEEQNDEMFGDIPRMAMRQTGPDQWQVILTEEERELINELLET